MTPNQLWVMGSVRNAVPEPDIEVCLWIFTVKKNKKTTLNNHTVFNTRYSIQFLYCIDATYSMFRTVIGMSFVILNALYF